MDLLGGRDNSDDLEIGETLVPLTSLRVILEWWHLGCQGGLKKRLLNLLPEHENSYHQWSILNFLWVVIICYILYSYYCYWVTKSCPILCDAMDYSTPGFPVLDYLLGFVQTHVLWVSDAIQPSHPLSPPSSLSFNLCQHQGLFQWVSFSHKVAKILELQLLHHSFQIIFRLISYRID